MNQNSKTLMTLASMVFVMLLSSCNSSSLSESSSLSTSSLDTSSISSTSEESQSTSTGCCDSSYTSKVEVIENEFDFDLLNTISYRLLSGSGTFSHIEGLNLADGDYSFEADVLTINPTFLLTLVPGIHGFQFVTTTGAVEVPIVILDRHNQNRIINSGFETGDLFGWGSSTVFKGETSLQAFTDLNIVNDGFITTNTNIEYNGDGTYLLGLSNPSNISLSQEKMGRLTSSTFTLSGSGWISFKLGGAFAGDLTYISIIDASNGQELSRYDNPTFSVSNPNIGSYFGENLVLYKADLSAYLNQDLYIQATDIAGREWNFITLDSVETYYESEPTIGIEALDIKPIFTADVVPNQVPNGDFSGGLAGWTESSQNTAVTYVLNTESLRSNSNGDTSRGVTRSSLFTIAGSGYGSLQIAAAKGTRYDKDTFVSIKEHLTNRELIRFANVNNNGTTFITYYFDLSSFDGSMAYIELVDNASSSWDTIFIDNVVTYYETTPEADFSMMAVDLNW